MSPQQLNALIASRRSVFTDQFEQGKQIPHSIVKQILINATWAPNHGHQEPWHFRVFTGKGLTTLANLQAGLYKQYAGDSFKPSRYEKLKKKPLKASHVIALCMKRSHEKNIPEIEDIEAVACAVQNIYLSVAAYELGGYWTTGGITYMEEAKPYFGLNPEDKLLGFFYMGYVAIPSAPSRRQDPEKKITWIDE